MTIFFPDTSRRLVFSWTFPLQMLTSRHFHVFQASATLNDVTKLTTEIEYEQELTRIKQKLKLTCLLLSYKNI